jgi:putative FmdB family regulatory protein
MPTYEYSCTECGEHFDVVQSFRDDPLTECALCGGQLRKVFGSIGIVFKGSGFYKTDSRSGSVRTIGSPESTKSESTKSESTKSDPAASISTSSSDSKPSTTTTTSSSDKPSTSSVGAAAAAS